MPNVFLDGAIFRHALKETLAKLNAKRKHLNQINVFPVPDGDTGNNLVATIESAYMETLKLPGFHLGDVAQAAYYGAREGSTGNSGAIFTQFLKGWASVFSEKDKAGASDLANALEAGTKNAYAAIRDPREGTILTVARKATEATQGIAEDNALPTTLLVMYLEARKALVNTCRVLPILRHQKVIDAGGWGLLIFFSALLDAMGVPIGKPDYDFLPKTSFYESRTSFLFDYPYDMEFVIHAFPDMESKISALIGQDGTELIIQPNDKDCHVHIHTNIPHAVVEKIMTVALIEEIVLRDMASQSIDHQKRDDGGPQYRTVAIGTHPGFLAMAIMSGAEMALNANILAKKQRLLTEEDDTEWLIISSVEHLPKWLHHKIVVVKDDVALLASLVTVFSTDMPSVEVILSAASYSRMARIETDSDLATICLAIDGLNPMLGEVLTLFFGRGQDRKAMEDTMGQIKQTYPELAEVELFFGGQSEFLILSIE
jgi:dihydroxyacetone kinase-like predicted kinase